MNGEKSEENRPHQPEPVESSESNPEPEPELKSEPKPESKPEPTPPLTPPVPNPPKKKPKNLLVLIVLAVVVVLAVVGFFVVRSLNGSRQETPIPEAANNPLRDTASEEEKSKPSYSLESSSENGTYPLFGSDASKNNSGEAYVDYEYAIINSPTSSAAEIFDAKLALYGYYQALGLEDEAKSIRATIDESALSSNQSARLKSLETSQTSAE